MIISLVRFWQKMNFLHTVLKYRFLIRQIGQELFDLDGRIDGQPLRT